MEPATPDEVRPLTVTSGMGYYTIGMLIDPGDWQRPGVEEIVRRVEEAAQRGDGNVVLLHDGGGDRSETVQALPALVRGLRAKGFALVTVSQLLGLPREKVMPSVPARERIVTGVDDVVFLLFGWGGWLLYLLFFAGIVLGCSRLALIGLLAAVGRWRSARRSFPEGFRPPVTVLVPAYNEEAVVVRAVRSLLDSDYPDFEVVVVDDGSTDRTAAVLEEAFGAEPRVRLLTKPNGGKAQALNFGLERARGEVVVALDADTVFEPGTLPLLVRNFADPRVGAVAGNAKVGNRVNLHTWYQALEYVTSQNLDRRAFDVLNCITVVPGSVGAWRKEPLLAAGGFSADTLAEDADLTLTLLEQGSRVAYEGEAVAYTEAPQTVRDFVRQRFRWMFGTLQSAWKHRGSLLRPKRGALGLFALPNIFVFQVLFPLVSPVMDLFMVGSLAAALLEERFHPADGPGHAFFHVLFYYALFLAVDAAASVLAFTLEEGEDWRLLALLPVGQTLVTTAMPLPTKMKPASIIDLATGRA